MGLAGRAWWLEAPAPRITRLGAYRLGGVAELDGAARDATPVAWCCRNSRAASGRVGEPPWLSDPPVLQPPTSVMGGGGAPKHLQSHLETACTLITRWSRRKSYIPAATAQERLLSYTKTAPTGEGPASPVPPPAVLDLPEGLGGFVAVAVPARAGFFRDAGNLRTQEFANILWP